MKSFSINYEDKKYVLSMNREVLKELETRYNLNILSDDMVLTKTYILFYGALKVAKPNISYAEACRMLDKLTTPNENGEVEYSLGELSKALVEITIPCISDTDATVKNTIQVM